MKAAKAFMAFSNVRFAYQAFDYYINNKLI